MKKNEKIEERAKFGNKKYMKCWEFVEGSDKSRIKHHKSATNKTYT